MEVYVSCPFCRDVFDPRLEDNVALAVDGRQRYAHRRCLPVASPPRPITVAPEPPPEALNGTGHDTPTTLMQEVVR